MVFTNEKKKQLTELLSIPSTTLSSWIERKNREEYLALIVAADEAIHQFEQYRQIMQSGCSANDAIEQLGLPTLMDLEIDGVSQRTFIRWSNTPEKQKLVTAFLIGHHWQLLTEISKALEYDSVFLLIKKLKRKSISHNELIRIYCFSPVATIKLLS